jgi:hypothetical protein
MEIEMTKRIINVSVGTPAIRMDRGNNPKPYITDRVSIYPDGTSIESLIDTLNKIQEKYGNDYTNLNIDSERDCGCYHDCTCSPSYYVWGNRLESDLEYDYRINEENSRKAEQEKRDRKAYEELKKKFGD